MQCPLGPEPVLLACRRAEDLWCRLVTKDYATAGSGKLWKVEAERTGLAFPPVWATLGEVCPPYLFAHLIFSKHLLYALE